MDEHKESLVRDAVAVMTAWAENNQQSGLLNQTIVGIAGERFPNDPGMGFLHVALALGNLCGLLLVRREAEVDISIGETLQDIGQRYAG